MSDCTRRAIVALSVVLCLTANAQSVPPARLPAPLTAQPATPAGVHPIHLPGYAEAAGAQSLKIGAVALGPGLTVDLSLERFEVFSPDATVIVAGASGERRVAPPPLAVFRGAVSGVPGSRAFLAITPDSAHGVILMGDETYVISSGPHAAGMPTVVFDPMALEPGLVSWRPFVCGVDRLPAPPVGGGGAGAADGGSCYLADVAIETDWEFTGDLFGGDASASAAYAGALVAAVSEIYTKDANVHMQIAFLRVWEDAGDLWGNPDCIEQLFDFQDYWNEFMTHVQRSSAHFFSGRALASAGGVAWLPGVCQFQYDYALSAYLNGFFPYPLKDHDGQNWDLMVVAHEFGHNFGSPHTHDTSPPVDKCGLGDCDDKSKGTIMSYCHVCEGGMSNIALTLHPFMVANYVLPYLDGESPCDLSAVPPTLTDGPDDLTLCPGAAAQFSASATGPGPLSYQWRKDQQPIPGATEAAYSIAAVAAADAGAYDVVVTGVCGSATSAPATLSVLTPPPGDLDGDCHVGQSDLGILLSCYEKTACGDVDGDGDTDQADLGILLANYEG